MTHNYECQMATPIHAVGSATNPSFYHIYKFDGLSAIKENRQIAWKSGEKKNQSKKDKSEVSECPWLEDQLITLFDKDLHPIQHKTPKKSSSRLKQKPNVRNSWGIHVECSSIKFYWPLPDPHIMMICPTRFPFAHF